MRLIHRASVVLSGSYVLVVMSILLPLLFVLHTCQHELVARFRVQVGNRLGLFNEPFHIFLSRWSTSLPSELHDLCCNHCAKHTLGIGVFHHASMVSLPYGFGERFFLNGV